MLWGDVESFTHIADVFSGVDIYNDYPKLKSAFKFWDDRQTMFWVILYRNNITGWFYS